MPTDPSPAVNQSLQSTLSAPEFGIQATLRRHAVKVSGRGSHPMVFANGFGCDQTMWRDVAPHFEDEWKCVFFDYVGSGRSHAAAFDPARYATLEGYASDLIAVCDALGFRDVVLVGHSVSASVGIKAAIARPDLFSHLILVGPSPCYLNDGAYQGGFTADALEELLEVLSSNFLGWSRTMAPAIMGNPERPDLGKRLADSFCQMDPAIAAHFARVTFFSDTRDDLPLMGRPALVLQCAEDIIAPDQVGRYVADHLPESELVRLKATGHCPHVSHPDEVVDVIKRYLRVSRRYG